MHTAIQKQFNINFYSFVSVCGSWDRHFVWINPEKRNISALEPGCPMNLRHRRLWQYIFMQITHHNSFFFCLYWKDCSEELDRKPGRREGVWCSKSSPAGLKHGSLWEHGRNYNHSATRAPQEKSHLKNWNLSVTNASHPKCRTVAKYLWRELQLWEFLVVSRLEFMQFILISPDWSFQASIRQDGKCLWTSSLDFDWATQVQFCLEASLALCWLYALDHCHAELSR